MQYFLKYNWVPNSLNRHRQIHDNNTSLFRNMYLENMSHKTLSNDSKALCLPFCPLRQPRASLH